MDRPITCLRFGSWGVADSRFKLKQADSRACALNATLRCPSYWLTHDSRILVALQIENNFNLPPCCISHQSGSDNVWTEEQFG